MGLLGGGEVGFPQFCLCVEKRKEKKKSSQLSASLYNARAETVRQSFRSFLQLFMDVVLLSQYNIFFRRHIKHNTKEIPFYFIFFLLLLLLLSPHLNISKFFLDDPGQKYPSFLFKLVAHFVIVRFSSHFLFSRSTP